MYVQPTPIISNSAFCIYVFLVIPTVNSDCFLNDINQLIAVMVKYGVLFEVRTEFLKIT
jgi:hypothetical protein